MSEDPMTGDAERLELRRICLRFGDPRRTGDEGINAAARTLCVSPTTLRRWLSGKTRIPKGTAIFLRTNMFEGRRP